MVSIVCFVGVRQLELNPLLTMGMGDDWAHHNAMAPATRVDDGMAMTVGYVDGCK